MDYRLLSALMQCYSFLSCVPEFKRSTNRSQVNKIARLEQVYICIHECLAALSIHTSRQRPPVVEEKTSENPLEKKQISGKCAQSSHTHPRIMMCACMQERRRMKTNAGHELQVRHSNRSCLPLSQLAILKGPANKTLVIQKSALHADGLVTSAANSTARLSDFHLLFSARPSWTLSCPPNFCHTNYTTATAGFHAGRCLRPRLRLTSKFLLCFGPKITPYRYHLLIFHIFNGILVNAIHEVVALRHSRRRCGIRYTSALAIGTPALRSTMRKHAKCVLLFTLVAVHALPMSCHGDHFSVWLFTVELLESVPNRGTPRVRVMSSIHTCVFPRLAWSGRRQVLIWIWLRIRHIVTIDLTEGTPGSAPCGLRAVRRR